MTNQMVGWFYVMGNLISSINDKDINMQQTAGNELD